jgi:FkbM family methyltransferase
MKPLKDILRKLLSEKMVMTLSGIKTSLTSRSWKKTYSQCGEDVIIKYAFDTIGKKCITYIDIGANAPKRGSNTFLFYKHSRKGICIEPNPLLFKKVKRLRKKDICLNMGITDGQTDGSLLFYAFSTDCLSTFSKDQVDEYLGHGFRIIEKTNIKTTNINTIIDTYFKNEDPDLISIDTEGFDYKILESFNFEKYRPIIFCVETLTFDTGINGKKIENILFLMENNGYFIYADTRLNTIFMDKKYLRLAQKS